MTTKRILTGGAKNFMRGGAVSFATVLIMTVTLTIVGSLIFLSAILSNTLGILQDKVDVNVYFVTDASEQQIMAIRDRLTALPDVVSVQYTSREQRLEDFRTRHENDMLTLQALDELGDNPLGAALAIKASDPSRYEGIVEFLSNDPSLSPDGPIIDSINYFQNKAVIDRLTSAITMTERAGLGIVVLFVIASIIISLATVRLAIYTSRDEIAVMRLVGATNMYIRGPFIVAGMMSGIIAAAVALAFFYPVTWYAGENLTTWLGGFNLFTYYTSHFGLIFLMLAGAGALVGAFASWLAVRRYLSV